MPDSINKKRKLQSVKASVRKGISSAGDAASEKARSARDATVDGVKAVTESSPAQGLASAGDSAAQVARDVASQGSEIAGDAAARGRKFVGEGIGSAKERVSWGQVVPDEAGEKLVSAIESSETLSGSAKRKMTDQLTPRLDPLFRRGMDSQAQIFSILQTSLAIPEASYLLNAWLQDIVKGTPTIYDKAMDAVYNSTRIGGCYTSTNFAGCVSSFAAFAPCLTVDVKLYGCDNLYGLLKKQRSVQPCRHLHRETSTLSDWRRLWTTVGDRFVMSAIVTLSFPVISWLSGNSPRRSRRLWRPRVVAQPTNCFLKVMRQSRYVPLAVSLP